MESNLWKLWLVCDEVAQAKRFALDAKLLEHMCSPAADVKWLKAKLLNSISVTQKGAQHDEGNQAFTSPLLLFPKFKHGCAPLHSQKGNIRVKFNLGSGFGSWRKQSGTCDDFSRISMWQARVQFASKFVCFFTACLWHFSPLTSLPALGQLWIIIDPHAKLTYSYAAKPAPTELRTSAATPKVSRAQKKMQYLKATKWSSCGTVIIRPHPDQNAPCIHKTENVWQYTCTPISCVLCGNVRKCAKSYMR